MSNQILDSRTILLALALKDRSDWDKMFAHMRQRFPLSDEEIEAALSYSGNFIAIVDKEYPERLRQRPKPPFVIFYEGDASLFKKVDNGNDFIFLHGPNTFGFPEERICKVTSDNRLSVGNGRLVFWFNDEATNIDRYGLGACFCKYVVGTKQYPLGNHSWFCLFTVPNALNLTDSEVYVIPGPVDDVNSWNNYAIDQGISALNAFSAQNMM